MKDRRGERGVGAARREHLDEMIERAGAARRDDRNRHCARDCRRQIAVESAFGAVAIDRREQDFAGAARLGFARPLDRIAIRRRLAAARVHGEAIAIALRIDRDDHCLTAVAIGERRDERRIFECRRVQAHLVGARFHRGSRIVLGSNPAADRERDEQLARDRTDRVGERAPRFDRRRDVEDHQLVDPFDVVAARQLRGVARGSKAFEVHPFDHVTIANVEARDDAF